jgi:hypothetical protein
MPMPWEQDYGGAPQAPAAAGAMPWEKDYGEAKEAAPKETLWGHIRDKWIGGAASAIADAATLPRDVYQGKVDPMSSEGRERALGLASMVLPGAEVGGTAAQVARRAGLGKVNPGEVTPEFRPTTPNIEAAQTASDLGKPLPAGIVSDTTGVQPLTQAARQLPLVGSQIDERIAGTIDAAGKKVGDISSELTGGTVPDRAVAGANLRPSLQQVIESNNGKIDQTYDDLRNNFIEGHKFGALPNTRTALDTIIRNRRSAGLANPEGGLDDVTNLLTSGRSFNGLVRARAQVGKVIGLAKNNPNPGFDVGDFKRLYAAMSGDMENVVRANARTGVNPNDAVGALRNANSAADEIIDHNATIQKLLNIQSDERLTGSVINAAKDKTGNARLLYQLRNQMPKQDYEDVVGVGLSELGHDSGTNTFSLNKFSKGWNDMSDTAKGFLIADPTHRKALDDIAKLGGFLKDADKYTNKSGTGRATAVAGVLGAGAGALASLDPMKMLGVLGTAAGGYGMTKILARPATANTLRKWATIAADKNTGRYGPARASLYGLATRNLITNLRDLPGFNAAVGPATSQSAPQKIQDRVSAP